MSARWIRSTALPALATGIVLFSFGCAQTPSTEKTEEKTNTPVTTTTQSDTKPSVEKAREAGQMAAAIEKEPKRLTEILEAHAMTEEAFQELIYEIAQDPELTDAYEAARTGSS
jgi:hypothetical protein